MVFFDGVGWGGGGANAVRTQAVSVP